MFSKILVALFILFFVLGGYVAYTAVTLPNVRRALEIGVEPSQTSQIFARDKTLIMSYGKFQHKPLPLADLPPSLIEALLATEDRRFYQHQGIDPIGIIRALVQNIRSQGVHEGGSTLTQQLARNIFLSNERSIQRKVKEALLALKLEQQLTKDQILELYLNNVYFGEGAYGVGAASNIYFGKPPKALNQAECALLAGLPQAPSLYSPFMNPDLARKRRNEVLGNLVETGKISEEELKTLSSQKIHLNPNGRALSSADKSPFFNRYVIKEVLGMTGMDEQTFWQRGLKVYTTLDPRAQRIAERQVLSISNAFGRTRKNQQAALLSVDSNGEMIAYVGGKDFAVSQFDRVSQARRQAGSLFKVFVYATALERGFSPLTVYKDTAVEYGEWNPENYDKRHHGFMTLAQALIRSNNVVAVKLLHDLTPESVIQTAQRMGIESPLQPNLSLALGSADVTLKEMVGAFSVFSNNGNYIKPYAIVKVIDRDGQILYQHTPEKRVALQRVSRDTMVAMMQGVIRFGTGRAADFGRSAAGKTGTSDNYRDAWFIGYTPEVTTGVWVGNDDNSKMGGITGGAIPARIWRAHMSRLLSGFPRREFDLSYALPMEEKDFFVYNLDNLSASEEPATDEERAMMEEGAQTEISEEPEPGASPEAQETYSLIDGQTSSGGDPIQPPALIPKERLPMPAGTRNELPHPAPEKGGEPDRFFDFKNHPPERYPPPSMEQAGKSQRSNKVVPAPESNGNSAGPRPIADPLQGIRTNNRLPAKGQSPDLVPPRE